MRTFGAASHSADHWDSISLFSRGRNAHLPSSSPPRRARDRHSNGAAKRPSVRKRISDCQKEHGWGLTNPKLVSLTCLEIPENYDTGKQSEETSPISRPGCRSCRSWRESPRRVWRLGARTSEERPEERRDEQQVRDVSDDSHRPSVEPVALGESPGGVPRGRRRRAPSPRSGRCTRTHHRGRLRAPRRRFDRRSHPASRGAPPTRGDAMLVVAVPFESHRFRVLRARARKCRVCYDMSFSNSVISSRKAARGPGSIGD